MSRSSLLFALALLLGVGTVAPRILTPVHAQDDDDEDEGGKGLTPEQKKEAKAIQEQWKKANDTIQAEKYEEGAAEWKKLCDLVDASKLGDKLGDMKLTAHYNLACCLSRTSKKDEAVKEFAKSVELGFWDWKHIDEDKDLDNIRAMDDFKKAVDAGKKSEVEKLVSQVQSGKPAFKFALEANGAGDKKVTLDTYAGKVLVVFFFNSQAEKLEGAEILEKVHQAWKDKGVQVLGLGFQTTDEGLEGIAKREKITFPLAEAEINDGYKPALQKGANIVLVDRSGKARAGAPAIYQVEALDAALKILAEEKAPEGGPKKEEPKKDDKKKDDF